MPSPFPGMDPYIEGQTWPDFHLRFIAIVSDMLVQFVRPRYLVRAEERIYLEHEMQGQSRHIRPDLLIASAEPGPFTESRGAAAAVAQQPFEITLPMPEEVTERYLTIADPVTREVITVIEILSPANKRAGSDGRTQYIAKRENVLMSRTNLVEIDLLRGGLPLPANQPLPPADHYVFVSRGHRRPIATVYPISLRQPLPSIPIPLAAGEEDASLDLQAALSTAYDRGGYDYSLDYSQPIYPPLSESGAAWAKDLLESRA